MSKPQLPAAARGGFAGAAAASVARVSTPAPAVPPPAVPPPVGPPPPDLPDPDPTPSPFDGAVADAVASAELWTHAVPPAELKKARATHTLRCSQVTSGALCGTFMDQHTDVNHRMRHILVDWMLDVVMSKRLHAASFFLAVGVLDRALVKAPTLSRKVLQLLGVTALWIAAKYEECDCEKTDLHDYAEVCGGAYTAQQLVRQEMALLREVDYRLSGPTVYHFAVLTLMLLPREVRAKVAPGVWCLLSRAACSTTMWDFPPQHLAAAAACLALLQGVGSARAGVWDRSAAQYVTQLSAAELLPALNFLRGVELCPSGGGYNRSQASMTAFWARQE